MLRVKQFITLLGDVVLLYGSLALALFIRRPQVFSLEYLKDHFWPFTIIFIILLLIFYIAGLYDFRRFKNNLVFARLFSTTLFVSFIIAALFFYLIPFFGITPKTVLFLFFIIFGVLDFSFRYFYNRILKKYGERQTLLIISTTKTAEGLVRFLNTNPQAGYRLISIPSEAEASEKLSEFLSSDTPPQGIILPTHLSPESNINKILYSHLSKDFYATTVNDFYENIFRKIPLEELNEAWFIKNVARRDLYSKIKNFCEPFFAFLFLIIFSPIFLIVSVLIMLISPGPVIYSQKRVGERGENFTLYKFRTMNKDAEKNGAQWAKKNDSRVTKVGKFLRYTHLDELPQLVNILKGNISFIGPRPERPEFVEQLREEIPFYDIRHISKPGITGWAQINYHYGASVEDAHKKLEYDIFYIKNRSAILDLVILLKTLKHLFTS